MKHEIKKIYFKKKDWPYAKFPDSTEGTLQYESSYLGNKKDGMEYSYYTNGNKKHEALWVNGDMFWYKEFDYRTKRLKFLKHTKNGLLHGEYIEYDTVGRVTLLLYFEEGHMIKDVEGINIRNLLNEI